MIKVEFKYTAVGDALRETAARLDDMTPLHQGIGEYVVNATKERFKKGVAPDGSAWAPKSPVTLANYLAKGDGARPDPLIGPTRRLSNEIASLASPSGVEVGSSLEYSAVMQGGARKGAFGKDGRGRPIPWGNIPARVWLGLSDADEAAIIDIADEYLEAEFDQRGFNAPQ
ncbi:phage virion morphogenesis protein [Sphingobium sp. TB-6]|uniref:phage virion morphogenesis protein n=1 Tax=Sphingobium sp. TB-6 TaxID=2728850 RepID=UPI00146C9854|nr:phage virion morphogenesis protein [Sphingobium sp. TB-6]NML88355.1 phage virion morphogenesis protein [Sphingobium sp. TB-6]